MKATDPNSNFYRADLMEDALYLMRRLKRYQLSGRLSGMSTEALRSLVDAWQREVRAREARATEGK